MEVQIGVTSKRIVRGLLLMRGYDLRRIAREYNCTSQMVQQMLDGRTESQGLRSFIEAILAKPVLENTES